MGSKGPITAQNAAEQGFIPVLFELVRAYQAFASFDAAGYRGTGLTVPQADVIFTLGNTQGMTFKEIGEKTLITKGTLTGVVDRLEAKGLVRRVPDAEDRRRTRVVLTDAGEAVFSHEFPRQVAYVKARFDRLSEGELEEARRILHRLREVFEA
jgi:MarR family 2-MHQ and catechol resistance regulon transcriptional repressor